MHVRYSGITVIVAPVCADSHTLDARMAEIVFAELSCRGALCVLPLAEIYGEFLDSFLLNADISVFTLHEDTILAGDCG